MDVLDPVGSDHSFLNLHSDRQILALFIWLIFGYLGTILVPHLIYFRKRNKTKRIYLASFVHPEDKVTLLKDLQAFLHNNGFVFPVKNEMG